MLEERDETSGHRHELLRRNIHVLDFIRFDLKEVAAIAGGDFLTREIPFGVNLGIRLGDVEVLVTITAEVFDLIGNPTINDFAVWCFDESEFIDSGKSAQRADETDVRTFRRFDRTDAAVVGRMDVADFESSAITAETAWPEGGETALVSQLGERIRLIHELAQLAAAKEVTNDSAERLRINELLRRDLIRVGIKQCHALADETLCASEADAALVGEKLTHGANAAAAEVVDVIGHTITRTEADEVFHRGDKIVFGECALVFVNFEIELLIDLVTTNASEIVAFGIKEEAFEHATGILNGWRIARAQFAVDVFEGLILIVCRIFFEGFDDRIVVFRVNDLHGFMAQADQLTNDSCGERLESAADCDFAIADIGNQNLRGDLLFVEFFAEFEVLGFVEKIDDVLVGRETHGAEECGRQKFAAAFATVEIDVEEVSGIELNFDPGSTVWDNAKAVEDFSIRVNGCLKANAG